MFRRKANAALNSSRRWLSHRSPGSRKYPSSYALTRSAAVVATAVAAATVASQKFIEGPIHNDNDTSPSSKNVIAKRVRVDGRDGGGDENELRLLVWGSNRYVCALIRASPASPLAHKRFQHESGRASSLQMHLTRCRSVRRLWLRSSRTWRCATWRCTLRTLRVSTDEGTSISGVTGSLRLAMMIESPR
jgi:hypothetical protein